MKKLYLVLLKHRRLLIDELVSLIRATKESLLEDLKTIRDYVLIDGEEIVVKKPLDLALYMIRHGMSVKEVSRYIDWRDFEKVSAEILSQHQYMVLTNLVMTKPVRLEIDVIGIDPGSGRGVFIDCKHWSRGVSRRALMEIMDKHVERIKKFVKYFNWVRGRWVYFKYLREIIPIIVTLTTPSIRSYNNTLAVSIQELNQVLLDLYLVLETFDLKPVKIR